MILRSLNHVLPPTGAGAERARPGRPGALGHRPGDAARKRPTRRSPPTPTCSAAGGSVVRVLSTACGLGIEGSGWAVRPDLIVTNAHVIAGADDTTVTTQGGIELDATAGLLPAATTTWRCCGSTATLPTLPISSEARRTAPTAAVLGYPENGPYAVTPARIGETRRDDQRGLLRQRADRAHDHRAARRRAQRQLGRAAGRRARARGRRRLRGDHGRRRAAASRSRPSRSAKRSGTPRAARRHRSLHALSARIGVGALQTGADARRHDFRRPTTYVQ